MEYTTEEMINIFENEGIELTNNIDEAIYIFDDGSMLSGMFVDGMRTEDHRIIELLFDDTDRYDTKFWDNVVERTRVIQYVPETKFILLKPNQVMTSQQQKIVDKYNLTVELF